MTFAPPTIRELAAFYVAKGGVNLGIVGDAPHVNGGTSYHLGADQLADGAYSAKLPRDVAGLSEAASAIDLGKLSGSLANLQAFSRWFVGWCQAGAPGTRDVREVIYSPDGQLPIHRWSGLDNAIYTGPGSGDASHLTHTHISFWRDSEFRGKTDLFAPYFAGTTPPDTSTGDPAMATVTQANLACWFRGGEIAGWNPEKLWTPAATFVANAGEEGRISGFFDITQPGDPQPAPHGRFARVAAGPLDGLYVDAEDVSLAPPTASAPVVTPAPAPNCDALYNEALRLAESTIASIPRR